MAVAALVCWLVVAVGAAAMAWRWVRAGGVRSAVPAPEVPLPIPGTPAGLPADHTTALRTSDLTDASPLEIVNPDGTRLTPPLVFGHAGLAVAGLLAWAAFLLTGAAAAAWLAVLLVAGVVGVGEVLVLRWFGARAGAEPVIESHAPVSLVCGQALAELLTALLALLATVGAGG